MGMPIAGTDKDGRITLLMRIRLRDLIDDTWNAATDSGKVPAHTWSDEIIDKWLERHNINEHNNI